MGQQPTGEDQGSARQGSHLGQAPSPWLSGLLARRLMNVATVAQANKNARIAWALLTRGEVYRRGEMARVACA